MNPRRGLWRTYGQVLALPLVPLMLLLGSVWEPVREWLGGSEAQDRTILREWLDESRGNLRGLAEDYLRLLDRQEQLGSVEQLSAAEKIQVFLETRAVPLTKVHPGEFPVFPLIYHLAVHFPEVEVAGTPVPPVAWESHLPAQPGDYEEMSHPLGPRAHVVVRYQLHAYDKRQREEELRAARFRRLGGLAVVATLLALAWLAYAQRRERERQGRQLHAEQQVVEAERARLQAERGQQKAERDAFQQKLAAQEYEQKMLEMKSQLYASIGIMAGSYAHNINNLLVRPNDLLRRCLEADGASPEQTGMLQEVRQTLGTVTERLQQILHTVRRDPTRSELGRLDLGPLLRDLERTWKTLAWERWKLQLTVELADEPLGIDGDLSHLQQAAENLLFNARDATFEMRLHLREQARRDGQGESARRQALIDAAAWKGQVAIRASRDGDFVVMEVRDNGVGMDEETRRRCVETHFTTKRDNARYEGHSTGMGLGLSFVQMVLDNHKATLEIDSAPLGGAAFRLRFPAAALIQ